MEHDFQATGDWDDVIYMFAQKLREKTMPRAVLLPVFPEPLINKSGGLRPAPPSFHLTVCPSFPAAWQQTEGRQRVYLQRKG